MFLISLVCSLYFSPHALLTLPSVSSSGLVCGVLGKSRMCCLCFLNFQLTWSDCLCVLFDCSCLESISLNVSFCRGMLNNSVVFYYACSYNLLHKSPITVSRLGVLKIVSCISVILLLKLIKFPLLCFFPLCAQLHLFIWKYQFILYWIMCNDKRQAEEGSPSLYISYLQDSF